jgi:hypothetical protein
LEPFRFQARVASPGEIEQFGFDRPRWKRGLSRYLGWPRTSPVIREKGHAWHELTMDPAKDACLVGYWHSERYFSAVADELRPLFQLRDEARGRNAELLARMAAEPAVSLHVRRGDYAANPATKAFHGLLGASYYQAAVARMQELAPGARFYVFSDEPAWVRENLQLPEGSVMVDHNGEAAQEDLRLMSACRHHVVANSSFSWWGAWLDPRPGKLVLAPRHWFRPESGVNDRDLVPSSWERL